MIPRYTPAPLAQIWSESAKFARWLEVELLATEANAAIGVVPSDDARVCRDRAPVCDDAFVMAVEEREQVTDHDVAAFVDVVQAHIGPPAGKWIHFGLTSSDVVDTALSLGVVRALAIIQDDARKLRRALYELAAAHQNTVMVGRTHGIHAEPTTFGAKVALWGLQVGRDIDRLAAAHSAIAVGKLSGAVGTYSNIDPRIEAHVCNALGLKAVAATQVLPRDRHAQVLYACAAVGSTCELIGTEIRHLQRTELREAEEPFRAGQKGSSAMPHKRNPITAERISGLARVLRGNLSAGLENVALWHERDISHSSVERIVLPDSTALASYVLRLATRVISGLVVRPEAMRANLERSHGLVFSQPVLLTLVDSGLTRDEAYRIVQENAMDAWARGVSFRDLVAADPRVRERGVQEQIDEAFSLQRSVTRAGRAFADLEAEMKASD